MPIQTDSSALPQPFRWLGHPAVWAIVAAAAFWLKSRRQDRVAVSPLSADWLQDHERQSIRGRE